jgi:hypothetical protein
MNVASRVSTQREQARTEAIRSAEWATDIAGACAWWIEQVDDLTVGTDARRMIATQLRDELRRWATTAESNARHYTDKANTITATLMAAARTQRDA